MNQLVTFFNMLWGIVLSFRLNDLLDILVISYIVYKMIQILRETRAVQLLKGLLFLLFIGLFAKILNLKALSVVTANIFLWGPIALVVLFQNELRRVLEHVGRARMRGRFRSFLYSGNEHNNADFDRAVIHKVANACESMAKSRTGAIIIFERKTKLGDIIETGVEINADISEDLIQNLFFKNSPLHDGAVVIRNTKIVAASCFLPKPSKEEYISRVLGSRHRAAIGMSEISDAIVVVVSEETGFISIAEDGVIKRKLSRTDVISYLQNGLK